MQKNYLAIDIGASSGRHIVGWMENGVLLTQEVYRFPNSVRRVDGHLEWDIDSLFQGFCFHLIKCRKVTIEHNPATPDFINLALNDL